EQLLRSGRVDAGLAALRDVLAAVGLRMPRAPALETLARRTVLALGRHGWRPRAADAIPRRELVRIDLCWSVAAALGMVDTLSPRASYFRHLQLRLALRAGER